MCYGDNSAHSPLIFISLVTARVLSAITEANLIWKCCCPCVLQKYGFIHMLITYFLTMFCQKKWAVMQLTALSITTRWYLRIIYQWCCRQHTIKRNRHVPHVWKLQHMTKNIHILVYRSFRFKYNMAKNAAHNIFRQMSDHIKKTIAICLTTFCVFASIYIYIYIYMWICGEWTETTIHV